MAYVSIRTNCYVDESYVDSLLVALSDKVARRLGKSEDQVMVALQDGVKMVMGGTYDPAALVEIRSLELDSEDTTPLAVEIADYIEKYLTIPHARLYIGFAGVMESMWAWHDGEFSVWSAPRRQATYGDYTSGEN